MILGDLVDRKREPTLHFVVTRKKGCSYWLAQEILVLMSVTLLMITFECLSLAGIKAMGLF